MRSVLLSLVLFLIGASLYGGYFYLKNYPQRTYFNWINGKEWNHLYSIPNYKIEYLKPVKTREIPIYEEDYGQLWKEFPLRNTLIPLPVRHPLYQTVPIIEIDKKNKTPQLGMIFIAPSGRELSRIYLLPNNSLPDHSMAQDLFKLTYVRNRIVNIPSTKLWNDIFSHEIYPKKKKWEEMIYDLYILHLRSKILPSETLKYNLLNDGRALIELYSKDKDYMIEIVMTNFQGNIHSFALRTEIRNEESQKLRAKFFQSIKPGPVDSVAAEFLYKEFKQLNFARQVDQEGMLYLFSAWSQDFNNREMFKEMIFYLERGRDNNPRLKPLYLFGMNYYGKTFSLKKVFDEDEDQNIALQRKIEIENIEKSNMAILENKKETPNKEQTPEEKMNMYLKKSREEKIDKNEVIVH